jgi:hypothetical protein
MRCLAWVAAPTRSGQTGQVGIEDAPATSTIMGSVLIWFSSLSFTVECGT